MAHSTQRHLVRALAYTIWEQEGRPDGRAAVHWAEAERRLAGTAASGHINAEGYEEDAPAGRPPIDIIPAAAKPGQSGARRSRQSRAAR
jgi:hypothetical protein